MLQPMPLMEWSKLAGQSGPAGTPRATLCRVLLSTMLLTIRQQCETEIARVLPAVRAPRPAVSQHPTHAHPTTEARHGPQRLGEARDHCAVALPQVRLPVGAPLPRPPAGGVPPPPGPLAAARVAAGAAAVARVLLHGAARRGAKRRCGLAWCSFAPWRILAHFACSALSSIHSTSASRPKASPRSPRAHALSHLIAPSRPSCLLLPPPPAASSFCLLLLLPPPPASSCCLLLLSPPRVRRWAPPRPTSTAWPATPCASRLTGTTTPSFWRRGGRRARVGGRVGGRVDGQVGRWERSEK